MAQTGHAINGGTGDDVLRVAFIMSYDIATMWMDEQAEEYKKQLLENEPGAVLKDERSGEGRPYHIYRQISDGKYVMRWAYVPDENIMFGEYRNGDTVVKYPRDTEKGVVSYESVQ